MKKLYSTIMMLAMMVAALGLTACGGDDEEDDAGGASSSSLVGTWDFVRNIYYLEGQEPIYTYFDGVYYVFTANKMTYHETGDPDDGKSFDYTFRGNKLAIDGVPLAMVIELTSSKLAIKIPGIIGYNINEYKKR